MLDALIDRLYGAFDKSPDAVTALTLPSTGISWSIADRQLTVTSGTGSTTVALTGATIGDVAATLTDAGVPTVASIPMESVSATVLMDGTGKNIITGHRSVLWAILSAYATELQYAKSQVPNALEQARLHSASGEWVDFWGEYFGCLRPVGMTDADFLRYIVATLMRKKTNAIAIEDAILELTGESVRIYEPWKDMFILGASKLDGNNHFQDGSYYTYNVIQPVASQSIDWTDVLAVTNRVRPAGTLVSYPRVDFMLPLIEPGFLEDDAGELTTVIDARYIRFAYPNVLDSMRLSADELRSIADERTTQSMVWFSQSLAMNILLVSPVDPMTTGLWTLDSFRLSAGELNDAGSIPDPVISILGLKDVGESIGVASVTLPVFETSFLRDEVATIDTAVDAHSIHFTPLNVLDSMRLSDAKYKVASDIVAIRKTTDFVHSIILNEQRSWITGGWTGEWADAAGLKVVGTATRSEAD